MLNHLFILHIHKVLTESLDLTKVANEFVEKREKEIKIRTLIMYGTIFRKVCSEGPSTFRFLLQ